MALAVSHPLHAPPPLLHRQLQLSKQRRDATRILLLSLFSLFEISLLSKWIFYGVVTLNLEIGLQSGPIIKSTLHFQAAYESWQHLVQIMSV